MSDGPNWEQLFRTGTLQPGNPDIPEHRAMVLNWLRFLKNTPEYPGFLEMYLKKGLVMDDVVVPPLKVPEVKSEVVAPPVESVLEVSSDPAIDFPPPSTDGQPVV